MLSWLLLQSPIGAYLDYSDILRVAKEIGCDAIHPGYGLLSENENFAKVLIFSQSLLF